MSLHRQQLWAKSLLRSDMGFNEDRLKAIFKAAFTPARQLELALIPPWLLSDEALVMFLKSPTTTASQAQAVSDMIQLHKEKR